MCGICGVVFFDSDRLADEAILKKMASLIAHRGPDGEGYALLGQAGLGHRRLSVIDLSTGDQPMYNEDRSLCLVFNGEIYNFKELREQLAAKGHVFSTKSDTEVILHLYEDMGPACVQRLRGMFAFALWDVVRRRLFLARDRVGKKPLYYCVHDGAFWFASELKALLAIPSLPRTLKLSSVDDYLSHGYIPPPNTILENVQKLSHGHSICVDDATPKVERYWKLEYEPKQVVSEAEALEKCDELIDESVRLRLESDVPLGVFLSGGIDSSLIVAMMRRHVTGTLRTFSIGFEHEQYNELPYARQVAQQFETQHEEFIIKPDSLNALPKLVWHFDEPFADSAALPTYYLSAMTRNHVTVALNGDGGDESFAGYDRYLGQWFTAFEKWKRLPSAVRRRWARPFFNVWGKLLPSSWRASQYRYVNDISLASPACQYVQRLAIIRDYMKDRLYTPGFASAVRNEHALAWMMEFFDESGIHDPLDRMLNTDVMSYLPEMLLPKVDRTTMSVGLEGRSPLLDQEVMRYAARLPADLKVRPGRTKHLLRCLAAKTLPQSLSDRKKQGFVTPLGEWFQQDLSVLINEVLLSKRAIDRGLFMRNEVEQLCRYEQGHMMLHGLRPWALINFEIWCRTFLDPPTPPLGPIEL